MPLAQTPPPATPLDADSIDDLIYFSRTGDLPSLIETLTTLSQTHSTTPTALLLSTIDIDSDGLGSGSSLLHYPAANGNFQVIEYLLSLLPSSTTTTTTPGVQNGSSSSSSLVNHRNVSGNTPLHWAGMNGHLAVVKALVAKGADPAVVNAAGRDAVVESEWSSKDGAAECATWMLQECGGLETGVGGTDGDGDGDGDGVGVDDADGNGEDDASGAVNGEHAGEVEDSTA